MTLHAILFTLLLVASCRCQEVSREIRNLATENTEFGLDLYKEAAESSENVFLSPYSVSVALAMLYRGADGNTKEEMEEVLGFDSSDNVHSTFKQIHDIVFARDKNYTLTEANKIFSKKGFSVLDGFQSELETNYGAPMELLDFQGAAEASRKHINVWVAEQTRQIIKDLLQPGTIDANTMMVLVNAIYFRGWWKEPFLPNKTKQADFHISSDAVTKVDMMHRNGPFGYTENSDLKCKVLEIPYLGDDVSMYIFLPNDVDGLSDLEDDLDADKLNEVIGQVTEMSKVHVYLPKFKITHHLSLKPILQELGMEDVFSDVADLSQIDGSKKLKVSDVIHQAFVEVNEEGTEAAASTAVIVTLKMARPTIEFHADHPFMFLIREKSTGTTLFLGRVANPTTTYMARRSVQGPDSAATNQRAAGPLAVVLFILMVLKLH